MSEQEPHPDSRMLLDCRHLDAVGQPRAMLDWRLTDEDMISSSRSLSLIGREIEAAGFGRFHVSMHPTLLPGHTRSGYDHMGTMRMHTGPAQGAVDADCRGRGIANLYVAGSSVPPWGLCQFEIYGGRAGGTPGGSPRPPVSCYVVDSTSNARRGLFLSNGISLGVVDCAYYCARFYIQACHRDHRRLTWHMRKIAMSLSFSRL